ncbi:MAG: ABC transporter substrate binding protein, partial [Acidobacteriota bacterium]
STEKIDLIIPVSLPAIDFIVKYDEELFPGIPVVFCTFGRHWVVRGPLPRNVTGVVETTTIDKTLAATLQLQPYTRSVVIVGGTLPYERDWMKEIRNHLRGHEGKLEFTYFTDMSMGELLQRVANLPPHTVVLYMMMWRDGAGEYFLPKEALSRIAQAANAPVYGVFESFMGSGLIGGDLVPFKTAGKTTAEVGLRVLQGENPADIPVLSENNASYIFDWRQLQRWHINEGRLPAGSLVLFKERSFWDRHKRLVTEVVVLIVAETIVILLLLVQRRKRKRAETSLRESEARYLAFVANSSEGIARFEQDQPMPVTLPKDEQVHYLLEHSYLAECNDAFARMYRVEMSRDFIGARLAALLLPSEPQSLEFLEAFVCSGYMLSDHLTKERDPQGHVRWFENRATGILKDGCLARTWIVQRDVTDRKRVERDLRKLGVRMLMVQEEERRRMARELHDDFSQRLALLAIDLEQLAQRPPATRQDWDTRIRAMWSQTQELTSDIHRLSHQLHPSKLEDLGLVMAVRSYCHEISKQGKLTVEFSDDNVPRPLPREVALCVYRIVQEALRNVLKHSGSSTAVVELKGGPEEIRLEVSDSGKGFDPAAATANEGLGLVSMRERVRNLGGELSITSGPAQGTRVVVRIPLAPIES